MIARETGWGGAVVPLTAEVWNATYSGRGYRRSTGDYGDR